MCRFSIIVPTFNSQLTIRSLIYSILSQTFSDYEVLVIDGLSTDGTSAIMEEFSDPRIHFYSEKDDGIYSAMNKGLSLSKGEWLYFIGSDDKLFNDDVLNKINYLIQNAPTDIFYGNVYYTNSKTVVGYEVTCDDLLFKSNICHQAIFYSRRVFELVGNYNIKYRLWSDWELNIRCFKHTNLRQVYINEVIAFYNDGAGKSGIEEDNIMRRELPVFYLNEIQLLKWELNHFKNHVFYLPLRKIASLSSFLNKILKR